MYNYHEAIKDDVLQAIREEWKPAELAEILYTDRGNFEMDLNDAFFLEDNVTGNGSGSYTFSRAEARGNLDGNYDILQRMVQEGWLDAGDVVDALAEENFERLDVLIRCFLLMDGILLALEELEADPEIAAELEKLRGVEEAAG